MVPAPSYRELAAAVMAEPTHESRAHVFFEVMRDQAVGDTTMKRLDYRARFVTAIREIAEGRKVRLPWLR